MAIKDILAFSDPKLEADFNHKEVDPSKLRAPMIKALDRTKEQFASATPVKGRKWFAHGGKGTIKATLPFNIGDTNVHFVPSNLFNKFLDTIRKSLEAGELDEAIAAGVDGAKAEKPATGEKKQRAGWSPERRKAQEAAIAAKRAAAGK